MVIIIAILGFALGPRGEAEFLVRARKSQLDHPVHIAFHRGANRYAPENTLASIKKAVEFGADYIEFDIRTTSDGHHVLMHDRTVSRTTNGTGAVSELRLEQIRRLDAGSWRGAKFANEKVPTVDEALAAIGDTAHAYLDAKAISPEALVAFIQKYRLEKRHVVYQSLEYCTRLKSIDPTVRCLPPLKSMKDFDKIAAIQPYGVDASWQILSAEMISKCHSMNIKVFSDALGYFESVGHYRQAQKWGIDTIQTDHPFRVLAATRPMTSR
jgi:glycerophosphoryl diester phosphodiesterase